MPLTIITILAIIGLLLSIYALYVEKKSLNKKYRPVCDINNRVSCTKAFSSSYGKILGIPNSVFGIIFYVIILILNALNNIQIIFYLAVISVLGSIYLAYVSHIKLKTFCIICNSIYLVNILLLIFSYKII